MFVWSHLRPSFIVRKTLRVGSLIRPAAWTCWDPGDGNIGLSPKKCARMRVGILLLFGGPIIMIGCVRTLLIINLIFNIRKIRCVSKNLKPSMTLHDLCQNRVIGKSLKNPSDLCLRNFFFWTKSRHKRFTGYLLQTDLLSVSLRTSQVLSETSHSLRFRLGIPTCLQCDTQIFGTPVRIEK